MLRTVDSGTFRSLAICALFRPSSYFPTILPRRYGLNSSPGFRLPLIAPKGRRGVAILCDIRRRVEGGRRDFSRKTRFAHRLILTYCKLRTEKAVIQTLQRSIGQCASRSEPVISHWDHSHDQLAKRQIDQLLPGVLVEKIPLSILRITTSIFIFTVW